MLVGLFGFTIISFFIMKKGYILAAGESFNRILQVIAILVSLSTLILGFNIFKKKILAIRSATVSAENRMRQYQTACIMWWVMIEVPGILAGIGYILTGNLSFLFLAILHIFLLFIFMPRKENIIVLLSFNSKEIRELEGESRIAQGT